MPEEEIKESRYNSAIAQLYRIDELWKLAHQYSRQGRFLKWNHILDAIWREIAADTPEGNFKKMDIFKKLVTKHRFNRNILNQVLMEKEIFLRKLQNLQGKGTAYRDYAEDDFD